MQSVMMRSPEVMKEIQNIYDPNVDINAPALPTPLSKVNPSIAEGDRIVYYHETRKHITYWIYISIQYT